MKRQALKAIALGICLLTGGLCSPETFAAPKAKTSAAPKYIFYFIGDGMGMGPVMTAQTYLRTVKNSQLTMSTLPVWSWIQTYSASSPVTDSAAAGTALSTGSKTRNYMLGMNADTVNVTSIAKTLKDNGYGIGVVTSVAPDDATPGAFYAHVPNRNMFYQIGSQMAEADYEFVAGAGLRGTRDSEGKDNGLLDKFAENNVQIICGPNEIEQINSRKVLLLNPKGTKATNIGYTIDSIKGVLNLPLITETCLAHLEKYSPSKFFMMVEGGNIDHALHANDAGAAVKEILNFDQALRIALDFYTRHPNETLIVVTADHDTGGMALINPAKPQYFDYQKISKEEFSEYCKRILKSRRTFTWDDMKQELSDKFGLFTQIHVKESVEEGLKEKFEATFENRSDDEDQKTLYASFNSFAVAVAQAIDKAAGIGFTTTSHSGNPVPLFAIGVGADNFKNIANNNLIAPEILRIALPAKKTGTKK